MVKYSIIGILLVLCFVLSFYGLTQRAAAQKFEQLAVQNARIAARQAEEAQKQQKLAEANAKEVHRQLLIAEQNLLECTQTKKTRMPFHTPEKK